MSKQIRVHESAVFRRQRVTELLNVSRHVSNLRLSIVNVQFIESETLGHWVLVDAGITGSQNAIQNAAEARFGRGAKPQAILITHGHFDHVGALRSLADDWDVPVFVHPAEAKYLDGSTKYAPPDPTVGGGLMSILSAFYPRGPIDVSARLQLLEEGIVPHLPGWQWLHTPGHTEGHVSFWNEADGTLVAGDALITTRQESAYAVMEQEPEVHGPPMYFTPDWAQAEQSVFKVARLAPTTLVTGHGPVLVGAEMRESLQYLAEHFTDVAVPNSKKI